MEEPKDHIPEPAKTMTVDKAALDALIKKVDEQAKTIDMLVATGDKGRLDLYQRRHNGPMPKHVNVRKYNGKYVLSTELTVNESYHNPVTGWHEKQELTIRYADGSEEQNIPLNLYGMRHESIRAKVLKSMTDSDGNLSFDVEVEEDGTKLTVDSKFVN